MVAGGGGAGDLYGAALAADISHFHRSICSCFLGSCDVRGPAAARHSADWANRILATAPLTELAPGHYRVSAASLQGVGHCHETVTPHPPPWGWTLVTGAGLVTLSRCHAVTLRVVVTRAAAATRLGPAPGWCRLAVVLGPGVCGGGTHAPPARAWCRGAQVSPSLAVWCLYTAEMVFIHWLVLRWPPVCMSGQTLVTEPAWAPLAAWLLHHRYSADQRTVASTHWAGPPSPSRLIAN